MFRKTILDFAEKWQQRVPLSEREANWAKSWSKWTNKTRQQVIELTYDLVDEEILKQKVEDMRNKEINKFGESRYNL